MRIYCPTCASKVPINDINIQEMVAKCGQCENIFNFSTTLAGSSPVRISSPIKCPKDVQMDIQEGVLQFSWGENATWVLPMLLLGILFGWLSFIMIPNFFSGQLGSQEAVIVIIAPFAAVLMLYWAMVLLLNRTFVTADNKRVQIWKGPLPWFGAGKHATSIERFTQWYSGLYEEEVGFRSAGYNQRSGYKEGNYVTYYAVNAINSYGKHERVIGRLNSAEAAQYIEQQIELFLNIPDQPISGELRRR